MYRAFREEATVVCERSSVLLDLIFPKVFTWNGMFDFIFCIECMTSAGPFAHQYTHSLILASVSDIMVLAALSGFANKAPVLLLEIIGNTRQLRRVFKL